MHEPVRSQLEEILHGKVTPGADDAVQAHLSSCPTCTAELREMQHCTNVVRSLRLSEVPEPTAGFYARVMQRIESQGRPSFWSLLLDPVFGRGLMYATGAMFLLMASFLLATTSEQPELARTPVQIMVQPSVMPVAMPTGFASGVDDDVQRDREHFLATMASFSE
ncbi:MAG: hypothetical protein HYX27_07205 [Acidobacteria bacterium]|nr:hypothetical protein [Acidobacteriota bacterium]